MEPLATCQTNIKCLEVVLDTLQSEMGLENVGEDDIRQVHGMYNHMFLIDFLNAIEVHV